MSPFGELLQRLEFAGTTTATPGVETYCIEPTSPRMQRIWNLEFSAELSVLAPHSTKHQGQARPSFEIEIHSNLGPGVPRPLDSYGYVPFVQLQALLLCWRYRLLHPVSQGVATLIRMPPGRVAGPEPITITVFNINGQWWTRSLEARDHIYPRLPPWHLD